MGRVSNSSVTKIRMPSKFKDKKGKEFIRTLYHTRLCIEIRGGPPSTACDAAATPTTNLLLILSGPEL